MHQLSHVGVQRCETLRGMYQNILRMYQNVTSLRNVPKYTKMREMYQSVPRYINITLKRKCNDIKATHLAQVSLVFQIDSFLCSSHLLLRMRNLTFQNGKRIVNERDVKTCIRQGLRSTIHMSPGDG